jgi:hypothetical protein
MRLKIMLGMLVAAWVWSATACSGNDGENCPVGSESCPCTAGGTCDSPLVCASNLCVRMGGDADTDADAPSDAPTSDNTEVGQLIPGSYYEDDSYKHFDLVAPDPMMQVFVVSDEPNTYCAYSSRGLLTSNPSTGFVVEGIWHQYRAEDTYCGWIAEYALLRQVDDSHIDLRSSSADFETAYEESNRVFTRR